MIIDVSTVPAEGFLELRTEGRADVPESLCPGASRGPAKLSFRGRMERKDGRFLLEGTLEAEINALCALCAAEAGLRVSTELGEIFAREPDDMEQWPITGNNAELLPVLRSALLTALPARVLCREGCKGLCPVCGADLNEVSCGCERKAKNLFADAKIEGSNINGSDLPER